MEEGRGMKYNKRSQPLWDNPAKNVLVTLLSCAPSPEHWWSKSNSLRLWCIRWFVELWMFVGFYTGMNPRAVILHILEHAWASVCILLVCVWLLCALKLWFLCARVKAYGESVCRSWVPVRLWEEGERRGGDGDERGFRLCTNRWHSTLLWLATVTQTKTGLKAHAFTSEENRKLDD